MAQSRTLKTSFAAGEVAPELLGRPDLRAWGNGARRLRNVFIQPTGGLTRRPGLRHVAMLPGPARLIAFEFNTEQTYLLVLTEGALRVFVEDGQVAQLAGPWTAAMLPQLAYTQSADTLLLCHPDVAAAAHHPHQPHRLDHRALGLPARAVPPLRRRRGDAGGLRHHRQRHPHRLRRGLRRRACRGARCGSAAGGCW